MLGGKHETRLILLSTVVAAIFISGCGVRINQNLPGNYFATVRYEITGSSNIGNVDITCCDYDSAETSFAGTTLPWSYQYQIDLYYPAFYYSVQARSTERVEKTTGTADRWNEFTFEDGSAAFTQTAVTDDYMYNNTDEVYGKIASVDSDTVLTLQSICFDEAKRTYKVYQPMDRRVSGIAKGPVMNQLIDDSVTGLFIAKNVEIGDKAYNTVTGDIALVTATAGNSLTLDTDIFPTAGDHYSVFNTGNEIIGSATATDPYKLIDGTKLFKTGSSPVSVGAVAALGGFSSFAAFAKVLSVEETALTLDRDIFSCGEAYVVFNYGQDEAFSTTQQMNKLIDSSAHFYTDATKECILYNTYADNYAGIASIDGNTRMTLAADLFPARVIEYVIYARRTLSLSIYINDELYKSVSSQWWNEVEILETGTITSQQILGLLSAQ